MCVCAFSPLALSISKQRPKAAAAVAAMGAGGFGWKSIRKGERIQTGKNNGRSQNELQGEAVTPKTEKDIPSHSAAETTRGVVVNTRANQANREEIFMVFWGEWKKGRYVYKDLVCVCSVCVSCERMRQ